MHYLFKAIFTATKTPITLVKNFSTSTTANNMELSLVVKRLQEYADLRTALVDWDNVGLLVEPSDKLVVKKMLVTNDLTEDVLNEAISKDINMIVSYHPVIFKPYLNRLTQADWKQRSIVKCIEKRIAVYSPHTSWDCIEGGINDALLSSFKLKKIEPIEPSVSSTFPSGLSKSIRLNVENDSQTEKFLAKVASSGDSVRFLGQKEVTSSDSKTVELEFLASPNGVVTLIDHLNTSFDRVDKVLPTLRINDLQKPLIKNAGLGRIGYLSEPMKLRDVVAQFKKDLNMKTFRLAIANGKSLDDEIKSIAVGAGSGSRVLNGSKADLVVTGEFSHHEILGETHRGVSVIVTDHSNTERFYLKHFKSRFEQLLGKYNESIDIHVSETDRDPLEYI